ncbi:MAG: hypothetical protein QOE97_2938 [Pseudonocardiales bacterium]|jgi:hypothetical protein|nr:hypothetical protein [Pseudonocardiales bacterium]
MSDASENAKPATGDDPKDRFREALERKRGRQAERSAAGDGHGDSKVHGSSSAVGGKRTFRRKSGG